MIIIGIDPGTTRIGYGVVKSEGNKITPVDYGLISNPGKIRESDLMSTYDQLSTIIDKYKPDKISIERLFFKQNIKTALSVSEFRGVILLVCAKKGVPVVELTPSEVKSGVSGYGKADKNQVHRMVKMILGIKEDIKPDDVADALAIAICGASNILSDK